MASASSDKASAERDQAVAIVLSRRIMPEQQIAFETGLRELISAASRHPGQLHAEVLRGSGLNAAQEYHIVYRFRDQASLRAWEATPVRNQLIARLDKLTADARRSEMTGMEAWFDLPTNPAPSRTKMALLTWTGIWPLVTAALLWLAPRLSAIPLAGRTAIITALVVIAMTYIVMPRLARLAAPWLARSRRT